MTEQERISQLEAENRRLQEKLRAEKAVGRAKCLLVERRGYTEAQAHRYIEKRAMDQQEKRQDVAAAIIEEYGGR